MPKEPFALIRLLPFGHALGGRPAQRLAGRLGVLVSRDTLLRQVKQAAARAAPADPLRVLGVDSRA